MNTSSTHPVTAVLAFLAVAGLLALEPETLQTLVGGCLFLAAIYAILHAIFHG